MSFFGNLFGKDTAGKKTPANEPAGHTAPGHPLVRLFGERSEHWALYLTREMLQQALADCLEAAAEDNAVYALPEHYGSLLVFKATQQGDAACQAFVQRALDGGATEDDVRQWWDMPDLERRMRTWELFMRKRQWYGIYVQDGLDSDAAIEAVRKRLPEFGDPDPDFLPMDQPFPEEMQLRVDAALWDFPEEGYASVSGNFSSMNAFLRIRLGLVTQESLFERFMAAGKYEHAKELLQEKIGNTPTDAPDYGLLLSSLGQLCTETGQYDKAILIHGQAWAHQETIAGPASDVAKARILNNFGLSLAHLYRFEEAIELYKTALELLPPTEQALRALFLNNLFVSSASAGNPEEALALGEESLALRKALFGESHPDVAESLDNLGVLHTIRGEYAQAEPLLKAAIDWRARYLGADHPDYLNCLGNLAFLYAQMGRIAEAEPLMKAICNAQSRAIEQVFPYITEQEQAAHYQQLVRDFDFYMAVMLAAPRHAADLAGNILNLRLATKGLLLHAAQHLQKRVFASGNADLIAAHTDWRAQKTAIARLKHASVGTSADAQTVATLDDEANLLEKSLAKATAALGIAWDKTPDWQQIQARLAAGEAAIEIILTTPFKKTGEAGGAFTPTYACIVLRHNAPPVFVPIAPDAALLDGVGLATYRAGMHVAADHATRSLVLPVMGATRSEPPGISTYALFWAPIAEALAGIQTVYLSPDGVYNQLNVGTLFDVGAGKYLHDTLDVRILGSLGDLLLPISPAQATSSAVLVGNPLYTLGLPSTAQPTVAELPQTQIEVQAIADLLAANTWRVHLFTSENATVAALRQATAPSVLHIATHGYYKPDTHAHADFQDLVLIKLQRRKAGNHPMMRAGLLLAGAENGLQHLAAEDSGILTAYEAMQMDMGGTLVVLSACETGLGDVVPGEGVMGLQRAFLAAGAQGVISSLWPVSDAATRRLMVACYTHWLAGAPLHSAFRLAQHELRKDFPAPTYWGAFQWMGIGK